MTVRIAALAGAAGIAAGALLAFSVAGTGRELPQPIPVFAGNETVIGQTIAYPAGAPRVTASIVVIPPGETGVWHTHAVPLFAYVLEGEVSLDYGSRGTRVLKAGDAILEAIDWPHQPTNKGTATVRILAVYLGADGLENATPAAGPR